MDRVHESVDCASPVHRGPAAIAALGSSAFSRSGARELRPRGGPANSMAGLTQLGRRWKGVSPAVELRSQEDDSEGTVRAKREGVGGVGGFTEGGVGFNRAEARPSVFNGRR
jgi:hypothetical protein